MSALTARTKHVDLLREISGALRQWSELERNVFIRAHYHGQSLKAISHSLKMDVEEVKAILGQCDRRLYTSLREIRKSSCEKHACVHAEAAKIITHSREPKSDRRLTSGAYKKSGTSRMAS